MYFGEMENEKQMAERLIHLKSILGYRKKVLRRDKPKK